MIAGRKREVVRKMADRTSRYIREIAGTLRLMKEKADDSLMNMEATLTVVAESIEKARATDASLREIVSKASRIDGEVSTNMEEVAMQANNARRLAESIARSGDAMALGTMEIYSKLCMFRLDTVDLTIETRLLSAAGEFGENRLQDLTGGRVHLLNCSTRTTNGQMAISTPTRHPSILQPRYCPF